MLYNLKRSSWYKYKIWQQIRTDGQTHRQTLVVSWTLSTFKISVQNHASFSQTPQCSRRPQTCYKTPIKPNQTLQTTKHRSQFSRHRNHISASFISESGSIRLSGDTSLITHKLLSVLRAGFTFVNRSAQLVCYDKKITRSKESGAFPGVCWGYGDVK